MAPHRILIVDGAALASESLQTAWEVAEADVLPAAGENALTLPRTRDVLHRAPAALDHAPSHRPGTLELLKDTR